MADVAILNEPRAVKGRGERKPRKANQNSKEKQSLAAFEDRLRALASRLENEAVAQMGKRRIIEDRWLQDLRDFYGKYSEQIEADLKSEQKSRLFVKLTRTKTNGWEARLSDMLFPTDDKNWAIAATPVPTLQSAIKKDPESQEGQQAQDEVKEATDRAELMETTIEDQLGEAAYAVKARAAIHDACKLGSGIMKGPMVAQKMRRKWTNENGVRQLTTMPDPKPDWLKVNPWNFYPDMDAATMEEAEFTFELHLDNNKTFRKRAREMRFNKDASRRLLDLSPRKGYPTPQSTVRAITGAGETAITEKYWVWEYHGTLDREEMEALLQVQGTEEEREEFELDDLDEHNVIMWFAEGEVLKFGPHPMDSGDSLYSVFNFEKDDMSIFGHGVPSLMRDSAASLNGAWRMIMDNGALAAGPQVVIDNTIIEPADGKWELTPRKVWIQKTPQIQRAAPPFNVHNIPTAQADLSNIVTMSKQFADDETSFPMIAQGESGAHQTTTFQGMAMLMNSVNVVFRRVVRNYDDDMTVPNITRQYDWNMQFNDDDTIKGDMDISATGSSVLLIKDIQAQNLMALATNFAVHPVFGPMTKMHSLYRSLAKSMMVPADEIVKPEDEWKRDLKTLEENKGPDPEMAKLELQLKVAQMQNEAQVIIAEMKANGELAKLQVEMMKLAEEKNLTLDELRTKLQITEITNQSKERLFAAEAALKQRFGEGI